VAALAAACESANHSVRLCALAALSRVPAESPLVAGTVLPALAQQLKGPNLSERRCAAAALGTLGPAAASTVESLRPGLYGDDPELHECAAFALGRIGKPGLSLLLEFARDHGALTRPVAHAIAALEAQGIDALSPLMTINFKEQNGGSAHPWLGFLAETGPAGTRLLMRLAAMPEASAALRSSAAAELDGIRGPAEPWLHPPR
jgi:hypothetical protein